MFWQSGGFWCVNFKRELKLQEFPSFCMGFNFFKPTSETSLDTGLIFIYRMRL